MKTASKIWVLAMAAFALWNVERERDPLPVAKTAAGILHAETQVPRPDAPLPKAVPVQGPAEHGAPKVAKSVERPERRVTPVPQPQSDIRMVPVERLLRETAAGEKARPVIAFGKSDKKPQEDDIGVDIGKGLPMPMPDSALITPVEKPDGFHVGVDYHVDPKWDLTGLAGVSTTTGPVGLMTTTKPYINQIGFKASYRF